MAFFSSNHKRQYESKVIPHFFLFLCTTALLGAVHKGRPQLFWGEGVPNCRRLQTLGGEGSQECRRLHFKKFNQDTIPLKIFLQFEPIRKRIYTDGWNVWSGWLSKFCSILDIQEPLTDFHKNEAFLFFENKVQNGQLKKNWVFQNPWILKICLWNL